MLPLQVRDSAENRRWWQGLSKPVWAVLAVAWLGWTFDIFDAAIFNFAKGPMMQEFLGGEAAYKLHGPELEAKIQMLFMVGWSVGGILFGILADRWGRVRTLSLTVLIYATFTGLTALCTDWSQVALVRFVSALGIGGEWACGAVLVAEAFPDRSRAGAAAVLQTAAAFGPALAALANYWSPAGDWRRLFLIGVAPALLTVFVRLAVKEPERFHKAEKSAVPLIELFKHPVWRRNALVGLVLGTVGVAGAQNVSFWLPNLVGAASPGVAAEALRDRNTQAALVMHIGTFVGVFFAPWLSERIGRKLALGVLFVASPLSVLVVTSMKEYGQLLMAAPLMAFTAIGLSAVFVLYFPELFATRVRATGAGLAYNGGRIVAAGVPVLTAKMMQSGSVSDGVARTALVLFVGIVALVFAVETKDRPLESLG